MKNVLVLAKPRMSLAFAALALALSILSCKPGLPSPTSPATQDTPAASSTPSPSPVPGPAVSGVAFQTSSSSASLTWNTDSACPCLLEYGPSPSYGFSAATTASSTSHAASIPGLLSDHVYYFRITALASSGAIPQTWSDSLRTAQVSGGLHAASVTALGGGAFRYLYDWSSPEQVLDWTPTAGASIVEDGGASPTVTVLRGNDIDVSAMIWKQGIAASRVQARASAVADGRHINIYTNLSPSWNGATWYPNPSLGAVDVTSGPFWMVNGTQTGFASASIATGVFYDIDFTVSPSELRHTCSVDGVTAVLAGSYAPSSQGRVALGAYRNSVAKGAPAVVWGTVAIEGVPDPVSPPNAPTISGLTAVTDSVTTISWSTDIVADSLVEYGTDGKTFPSYAQSSDPSLTHVLTIEGLQPGTQYWFRASSRAATGAATTAPASLVTGGDIRPDEIVFKAGGTGFSAIIETAPGAAVLWTFPDGSTSSSLRPSADYGSAAVRFYRLKVTPWNAIRTIDIGYNVNEDGGNLSADYVLPQQNVTNVYGMQNAAPSLQIWASSHNPLTALDFHDFTSLHTVEAFLCQGVRSVDLRNTPSLRRLCLEDNALDALDLSGCPNLEDLRGALNNYSSITWGATGDHVWHICVRDNPQISQNHPDFSKFPLLRDLFIWNDNQSGVLAMSGAFNTQLVYLAANQNHYTSASLTGLFPSGRDGAVELAYNLLASLDVSGNPGLRSLTANNNQLSSLDISGDTGLSTLALGNNLFDQAAVDGILALVDGFGGTNGSINLGGSGNAAPSAAGAARVASLQARGWTVTVNP